MSFVNGGLYLRANPKPNGDWWYQVDSGSCAKATARNYGPITGLTAGSSHTATAYRDSGCVTAMAPTNSFTVPSLSATVNSDQSVDLSLSDYPGGSWWYQNASGTCTAASGTTVSDLTGYAVGTHTATAYAENNCKNWIDTATFAIAHTTTVDVSVTNGDIYLRPDHAGDWWFQIDDGSCTKATARNHGPITGISAGSHTATVYRDSGCVTAMAASTFTIPQTYSLATSVSNGDAYLQLSPAGGDWWYKVDSGSCTKASSRNEGPISGLSAGSHSATAYKDSGCATQVASASFTIPQTYSLATSVSSGDAYLQLSPAGGDWWYKVDSGSCTKASSRNEGPISGLSAGSHSATAYKDSGCATQVASASFTIS